MAKFARIKGAVDYYPEDMDVRKQVFSCLRSACKRHGFQEIDVAAVESLSLLIAKQGEEITAQIFSMEKKGDEQLALRAEFTPSFARAFIDRQKELQKPVKWFTIGKVWRYERPQAGRQREFFQLNAEVFGSDKPEADAEVINLAVDTLCSLGLTQKDFFVKVNNRKLLQGLLLDIIKDEQLQDVLRAIDKKQKISDKQFAEELSFLNKEQVEAISSLLELKLEDLNEKKMSQMASEGCHDIMEVMRLITPGFARFDLSVARGLAYYTGTVFEIFDTDLKFRALTGGGRYDNLISLYGGDKTAATGFGMGYSTVSMLLEDKKLVPKADIAVDYFIAILDEVSRPAALSMAQKMRMKYSVETDLMRRNLGNQLKYAKSIKARKLIIFGPEELQSGFVKVKDIASGKEEKARIEEI